LIVIFAGSFTIFTPNEINSYNNSNPVNIKFFVEHDPIEILNDTAFILYGFEGEGTEESPYIIENFQIESFGFLSNGIYVTGTTDYFIIRNNYLIHEYLAINIHDVAPHTSQVINNTCVGSIDDGCAIGISYTTGCLILDNICSDSSNGIHTNEADSITIKGNKVSNSIYHGISLRFTYSCNVTYNDIRNSGHFGLALIGGITYYNLIHHNTFVNNGISETYNIDNERFGNITSQAYDEGTMNTWYDEEAKTGNFWSDYSGKGDYAIDGPTESFDIYPMKVEKTGYPYLFIICIISMLVLIDNRRSSMKKR
jgi:parallel beta-helix repeat protein